MNAERQPLAPGSKGPRSSTPWLLLVALTLLGCSRKERCSEIEVQVLGDHAHSAKVSPDKVKRGEGGAYRVHGDGHDHALLLKDEDVKQLALGATVTVRTSSTNAHMHEVTVRCKQ
jgi:hypothetical protein